MYYNLTKIFKDINNGNFAGVKPTSKKRLGNFKSTWGKRIKTLEELEDKKLMYVDGRGGKSKTLCRKEILIFAALYINSRKSLENFKIEHKLIFDSDFMGMYIEEFDKDETEAN